MSFRSLIQTIQTKKRQSVDETSEWGRYADYPSARGRALFALMGRLCLLVMVERVVNSLPGGDHSLFRWWRRRSIKNSNENNSNEPATMRSGDDSNVDGVDVDVDVDMDINRLVVENINTNTNTNSNDATDDAKINGDNNNITNEKISSSPSSNSNSPSSSSSVMWASHKAKQIRTYSGRKLADGLLRLGPLYIKIGQIISCRENLLPHEWSVALERLQDRVPAKSGNEALQLAIEAYSYSGNGEDNVGANGDLNVGVNGGVNVSANVNESGKDRFYSIFREFDDVPLAAASLGQVHRAVLRSNNATVAIKLQRSRLRDIYDKDLALMNKVAVAVDKFSEKMGKMRAGGVNVGGVKQSWEEIFKDAETILYREIDYRDEAANAMRFASDFGIGIGGKAVPCTARSLDGKVLPSAASWIRTPFVYEEYSTEKILVMEYVPSIKISEGDKLSAAGLSLDDREYLAECLARAYLRQFCVNKFFSTDPHPGNLGVEIIDNKGQGKGKGKGKGVTPRLVFYDFGQACTLKDEQSGGILDVIEGIVDTNVDNCVSAFTRMGVLVDGADLTKVKSKVQKNFETGLIKVKRKRKKSRGKSGSSLASDDDSSSNADVLSSNTIVKSEELNPIAISSSSTSPIKTEAKTSNEEDINDAEIMSFFTLPAEYAFVARAISQMDGVGKGLDADFDFISASAPYLVEIKGGEKYVADEVKKLISPVLKWQNNLLKRAGYDPLAKKNKNTTQ